MTIMTKMSVPLVNTNSAKLAPLMSSGQGVNTKQGRCYPFWTEVSRCRQQPNFTPEKCSKYVEDFMECLFHKKEVTFKGLRDIRLHTTFSVLETKVD